MPLALRLWLALKGVSLVVLLAGNPVAAAIIYLLLDPWLFYTILSPSSRGFGPVVATFNTTKPEVWLTIDDGPDPQTTPQVLDLLEAHGARATFFVIGQNVDRHPELAREIVRRGHALGNHTATHPCWSLWRSGTRTVGREIDGCSEALRRAGLPEPSCFRVPVGIKTPFVHPALSMRGMDLVAWSARGFDRVVSNRLAERLLTDRIKPGAIILLHEGGRDGRTFSIVETVLKHLEKEKLRAVIPSRAQLVS